MGVGRLRTHSRAKTNKPKNNPLEILVYGPHYTSKSPGERESPVPYKVPLVLDLEVRRSDKEKRMLVISVPVLLLESRVVMSSPVESGHSNWTLAHTGGRNCRCLPLGTGGREWRHPAARSWGGRTAALQKGSTLRQRRSALHGKSRESVGEGGRRELACSSSG